jgi:hypothetical protein
MAYSVRAELQSSSESERRLSASARSVTGEIVGCWATAIAQIAYYHRLSPTGHMEYTTTSGIQVREDLGSVPFRFDLILPRIDSGATPKHAQETARYIYEVAVAIQKDFGGDGVMDHDGFIGRSQAHLGATAVLHEFTRGDHSGSMAGDRAPGFDPEPNDPLPRGSGGRREEIRSASGLQNQEVDPWPKKPVVPR